MCGIKPGAPQFDRLLDYVGELELELERRSNDDLAQHYREWLTAA